MSMTPTPFSNGALSVPLLEPELGPDGRPAVGVDTEIIDRFKRGFSQWKNDYMLRRKELFDELSRGQSPKVLVIACADSRVNPVDIFKADPGDCCSFYFRFRALGAD